MGYKVRTIEYNESAVSQALDSLFKYSFAASESAKDRAATSQAQREQNEFEKSQLFLETSLDNLKSVKDEISELKITASEHGLTQIGQGKLTDADRTTAFQDITKAGEGEINTALTSLNKVKDSWTGVVGDYNRGRNLANTMDAAGNGTGAVSMDELGVYYQENAKKDEREFLEDGKTINPNWGGVIPEGKAFEMGVASWTLDPKTRRELELYDIELKTKGQEYKWLAGNLKLDFEKKEETYQEQLLKNAKLGLINEGLQIDSDFLRTRLENAESLDEFKLEQIQGELETLRLSNEQQTLINQHLPQQLKDEGSIRKYTIDKLHSESDILNIKSRHTEKELLDQEKKRGLDFALTKTGLVAARQQMANTKFDLTDDKYTKQMDNFDRMGAEISERQVSLGVQIMSNISLLDVNEEDMITPMTTVTSSYLGEAAGLVPDSADTWSERIQEDDGGHYSHIKGEIVTLASSVVSAKGEDMLPDYHLMLEKVREVSELRPSYEKTVSKIRQSDYYKQEMASKRRYKDGTLYDESQKDAMIVQSILDGDDLGGVGLGVILAEERLDAHRFVEWKSTGILDNPELIKQANASLDERIRINELKTQLMSDYTMNKGAQSLPDDVGMFNIKGKNVELSTDDMSIDQFIEFLER